MKIIQQIIEFIDDELEGAEDYIELYLGERIGEINAN